MSRIAENWLSSLKLILAIVILLWLVEILNSLVDHRLNSYGIYPREIETLPGILLWPFLHGNFQHLIMNTTPLMVMGFLVALRGWKTFVKTTLLILVIGGLGVWIFGRSAFHIGASGLVFGFLGFLVTVAIYERNLTTFAIAFFIAFYYGGLIFGILPGDRFISWEGHLFGLLAGIISARLLAVTPRAW